jgi:hypothetical protein
VSSCTIISAMLPDQEFPHPTGRTTFCCDPDQTLGKCHIVLPAQRRTHGWRSPRRATPIRAFTYR